MAAPKGPYTPKSGPLAGQTFETYYRYQNRRAKEVLGFQGGYSEQRKVMSTPFARGIFTGEKQRGTFGPTGQLRGEQRDILTRTVAEFFPQYRAGKLTGKGIDKSRGGALDMFLRRLGRREGNETWSPGETPKR